MLEKVMILYFLPGAIALIFAVVVGTYLLVTGLVGTARWYIDNRKTKEETK